MTGQRRVWVWVGLLWDARVRSVLDTYGDRISDVSIFGWAVDQDGSLTQTFNPAQLDAYRAKWPHIRWWACFRNMDAPSGATAYQIWQALRFNSSARSRLSADLAALLAAHPWLHGIDIDLEGGGDLYSAESEHVFRQVASVARAHTRQVSAALPALTAGGSVGGENWVRYRQLGEILDHVSVMSYDFAWNGSAPGPISPGFWMRNVYDWAASQIPAHKLSMGLPAYARAWMVHAEPPGAYRGVSTNYYGMRNYLDGTWNAYSNAAQSHVPWLAYRDPDGMVPWAFVGVYDWLEPDHAIDSRGVAFSTYDGRRYLTRYSRAAGDPLWTVAGAQLDGQHARYTLRPRHVRSVVGAWVEPNHGYNLTLELLRRRANSAPIIDDDCRTLGQLATAIYQRTGSWSQWSQSDDGTRASYGQYRAPAAGGSVQYGRNFGAQALHVIARAQLPAAGRWGVTIGKVRVEIDHTGLLRIIEDGAVKASATIAGLPGVSTTPGSGRITLGIRARGTHVRAYAGTSSETFPLRLEADVAASSIDGTAGVWASGQAWFDWIRLGDGWWYMPREAVEVVAGGQSWLLGRDPRTGVAWDHARNLFRPNTDVEESATLTLGTSLDWDFAHVEGFPIATGQTATVEVRPYDPDVWQGRLMLCDSEGARLLYGADSTYLAHWLDIATHDYGLQGIAIWTLGQEDVRFWERITGGGTPRLNY